MTKDRKDQIAAMLAKYNRLHDKTKPEKQLLRACRELLEDTPTDAVTLESEYKRGYEDGVHDEADRQYEAKQKAKAAKAAKEEPVPIPPEDMPFGEVE